MWQLEKYGDNIAVIDEVGKSYSYTWLKTECDKILRHISRGRSLTFNLCSNEIGSLLGYVAFVNNRIVPLLLDAQLNRELLQVLIKKYRPDYLWLPAPMAEGFDYREIYTAHNYTLMETPYCREFPLSDELALLLTTSGSTGSPKVVRQSYVNLRANTESIVQYLEIDESERSITTLPMSYSYGLSIINSHLYAGASMVFTRKTLMEKEFWQQFKEHQPTSFGGVPYVYEMLDKLRFTRMNLPSLRTMTQAGGKLSLELHEKFAEYAMQTGRKYVVMYGQTEATARMGYLPWHKAVEKRGSIGLAIPGGAFSLVDDDGENIFEAGIVGELVYEGPNVSLGYADCGEDLQNGDENKGRLLTGDMAKRDEEGFYYIVGRKKRFLKLFGNRVNLDETEQMIRRVYTGMECVCSGVDDLMHVFIDNKEKTDDVRKYLVEKTGLNKVAFKVVYIDEIPRNESGKILYSQLEQYY